MCRMEVVKFYGDNIWLVVVNSEPFVPVRPICENLGLKWSGQRDKLMMDTKRWDVRKIKTKTQDGKMREMLCLSLRKLPAGSSVFLLVKSNPKSGTNFFAIKLNAIRCCGTTGSRGRR